MKRKTTWIKALGSHFSFSVVLVVAVTGPLLCFDGDSPAAPAASITVMTRNLYVGASFRILAGALTPNQAADRVAQVYGKILSSQFSRRADAIAEEIVQTRPDVVGLQEAPLLIVQSPGECSAASQPQPRTVAIDYLQILFDALQRRHANYTVAAVVNNTDVTSSSKTGDTIRFIDRDVILVRNDLHPGEEPLVLSTQAKNFDIRLSLEVAGKEVTLLRGWCSVDVKVGSKLVRVVNTHLEEEHFDLIQTAQADELLTGPFQTRLPVIVLGDFNTSEHSITYKHILQAGFKDGWALTHPDEAGFSCCQDEDLLNLTSELKERIDFIFYHGSQMDVRDMKLVGADPSSRIASGQWPSDHAGVVATFSVK